jgi:pimeloyl-ACP methyl ester carboxylesterase
MNKIILTFIFYYSVISSIAAQEERSVNYGDNKDAGKFKIINGINLYYETYGSGKPLFLLHGNGGSISGQGGRIEYFKKYFQVIAIDSRSHGKSVDATNKPLTYLQMAYDVKILMDSLKIDSAYVWGQSDGGIIGLLIAINYPEKISKLATFGANIFPGKKAVFDEIDKMVKDTLKSTKDRKTKNLYSLMAYQPNITERDLNKINCQVLIMSGDRDAIRLEHSIKIFNNIENSNFFVMPGATHFGSYQKPELFNIVLLDFLT